jgi:hypothetical protein
MTHTLTVHEGGLVTVTQHSADPRREDAEYCTLHPEPTAECDLLEAAVWEFGLLVHHPGLDGDALPAIDSRPTPGVYRVELGADGNIDPGGRIS